MADIWQPRYSLTNGIVNGLTAIEAAKVKVEASQVPPTALAELSRQARIRATHYSTRIEGNRLTLEEAAEAIAGRRRVFHGRERDVAEVRNYWDALSWVEEQADKRRPITEELVQRIHAIAMHGKRAKSAPYRTGQNVIRDSATGAIVYMPPEAGDVPRLMCQMAGLIGHSAEVGIPAIIIAGLAHYQFVTIHPYYDGNGRTARLFATYIMHLGGYGLGGIFSLEEYHSRDIAAYYGALDVGGHHNYYIGRADADVTGWLEYFIATLQEVFESAKREALKYAHLPIIPEPDELRRLDNRARMILALFSRQDQITSTDVAQTLGLSQRMARVHLSKWVTDGWLQIADPSRRARKYALSPSVHASLITPHSSHLTHHLSLITRNTSAPQEK